METLESACTLPDRERLLLEYIRGTISAGDADRFEAHCMTCDECSAELERGVEIRSVAPKLPVARGFDWRWLAAAASVVLAVSVWQLTARSPRQGDDVASVPAGGVVPGPAPTPQPTPAPSVPVTPPVAEPVRPAPPSRSRGADNRTLRDQSAKAPQPAASRDASGAIRIAWPPVEGATRYVVTVFSTSGSQLFTRDATTPSMLIDATTAAFPGHADERLVARVDAVDAFGVTLAQSAPLVIPARREEIRP